MLLRRKPLATQERDVVRELARRVAQIAVSSENEMIRKRWRDVNALRKPDRAPILCRPVGCWKEIIPPETLVCQEPWLRGWEYEFRQILHKHYLGDDSPLDSFFSVSGRFDVDPPNTWGVEVGRHTSASADGAWAYDPPLKSETDFEKLRLPKYRNNEAATREILHRTQDLLADILPVKLQIGPGYDSATLGTAAADLRGLEQIMMDMIDQPGLMHRLMAYLLKARMRLLDAWEATGLLTLNNTGPMLCSDPIGPEPNAGGYTLKQCWCAGNSQEFDQVSPDMWEEFCLNYQKPIFERFGLVCYGCCENLTHKIDRVLSIPNLRIFVCSAWTNMDVVLDRIGTDYCIMWRQKAGDVVFPDDPQVLRHNLEEGARRLQGRRYQIVLRELQTLCGHSDRLEVWTKIAKEVAAKYA
jgi:hypothetical protein